MKLWNYITLITGVCVLLALAGLNVAGITQLLSLIGVTITNSGIVSVAVKSTIWDYIFSDTGLLVSVITTGAVGLGLYIYTKDKAYIILPLITGVWVYWLSAINSIVQQVRGYEIFGVIIGVIGIVLSVGFLQSCVDYFMGVDN